MEFTHASFFSGVGGLDLGLERAGWRTVSFSEIEPYACAVLAERWPAVPNLGDVVRLAAGPLRDGDSGASTEPLPDESASASLWSGGFPCQDLSVAGKRRGLAGARSGLAFAFLDLVERHRPPAVLLENVPGLLSSHGGKDLGALLGRLGELGYWWTYRILDAQHFGVPQRRRRVFIVALHAERGFGPDSAAAVLSVGTRCPRHPATGHATGEGTAGGTDDSADIVGTIPAGLGHHGQSGTSSQAVNSGHVIAHSVLSRQERLNDHTQQDYVVGNAVRAGGHGDPGIGRDGDEWRLTLSPSPDPGGVRALDGLAGGVDDLAPTLRVGPRTPQDGGPGDTVPVVIGALNGTKERGGWRAGPDEAAAGQLIAYRKSARVNADPTSPETWVDDGLANTLNDFDIGDIRTTHIALGGRSVTDDALLPLGLDSHRYRCCGNGVVSSVAEWIGRQLLAAIERAA